MAVTNKNQALDIGFKLQDYTITKVLSSGGFSFVYLAHDPNKKVVAIKEYMPTGLALRNKGATVQLDDHGDSAVFKQGLKSFLKRVYRSPKSTIKILCACSIFLEPTTRCIW